MKKRFVQRAKHQTVCKERDSAHFYGKLEVVEHEPGKYVGMRNRYRLWLTVEYVFYFPGISVPYRVKSKDCFFMLIFKTQ